MDQQKTGALIARLRRSRKLTQAALGSRLGVTNKTVSRWETGRYLPDVETLQLLGAVLGVSMEELLAGETAFPQPQAAPAPVLPAGSSAGERQNASETFCLTERIRFWRRRWWRAHWPLAVLGALGCLALLVSGTLCRRPWLCAAAGALAFLGRLYLYNRRMAYIEARAYGPH